MLDVSTIFELIDAGDAQGVSALLAADPATAAEHDEHGLTALMRAAYRGGEVFEAVRAAKRAGAVVHGAPSVKTTVVVRGRPNVLQAAGRDAGRKLMEIKRLREKGHRITLLAEARFWRLADAGRKKKNRRI